MSTIRLFTFSILLSLCYSISLEAQSDRRLRKLREERMESWPPEVRYSSISLGNALQRVFKKHYEFCGFPTTSKKRDFTPPTLERFLGRRTLRTRVEQANLSGGNLLNYVFRGEELDVPLDVISYQSDRLIDLQQQQVNFMPQPREGFDAFVMTKNCSGYLKACLDAGIQPPYTAFGTALSTDERRESSVLALAGSFVSPLAEVLSARDSRTTELMSQLWLFYQANPQYAGRAYYLREFEGVLVKHLSNAEAIYESEKEFGVNVNLPFSARLNATVGRQRSSSETFSGTDWETIVYADFSGPYQRESMYAPLPTPDEIIDYFAALRPTFANAKDFPLLTEGAEHRHYLSLVGIPAELARLPWRIQELSSGVYEQMPRIDNRFFAEGDGQFGLEITVAGRPDAALFSGRLEERSGSVNLHYVLESGQNWQGRPLRMTIDQELATSLAPTVSLIRSDFDLSKRDNRQFACQWEIELAVEDGDNPIAADEEVWIANTLVRNSNAELAVELVESWFNERRGTLLLTFSTRKSWPLDQINDRQMNNFNLSAELQLPTERGNSRAIRPIKAIIAMPTVGPRPAPPTPKAVPPTVVNPPAQLPLLPPSSGGQGG